MNKKIRRFLVVFNIVLMTSAIVGTQFVATVSAKKPIVNVYPGYRQQLGALGGANYEILIPNNWNGMLVIGCRGYAHDEPPIAGLMHQIGMSMINTRGVAYAWSTFGEGGVCIQKGMIRTHQLTEYVIENYNVQGKVLLFGVSMGGLIACMLGEKYPNLYDGVLDLCGPKDMASMYFYKKPITELPADAAEIRAYLNGPPANMPMPFLAQLPDAMLLQLRTGFMVSLADQAIEFGGTPETKPKAFERVAPIYHADIAIPVISIIGEYDISVIPLQFDMYYDAVEEAGCLDYYRSYVIPNATHVSGPALSASIAKFTVLINWAVTGTPPDPTPPPIP